MYKNKIFFAITAAVLFFAGAHAVLAGPPNPLPVLTAISPSSTTAGSLGFTLTLTGSSFISTSQVQWNGSSRTTTFVSSSSLTAAILTSDLTTSTTAAVTVVNPTPGGGTSAAQTFIIGAHVPNPCTSAATGNWSASSTWSSCGGGIPTASDPVTILTGHIVTVDIAAVAASVTINANAAAGGNGISINAGQSLTVGGAVTLNIPTAATTDLTVGAGTLTAASIAIPGSATANRFATVSVSTGIVTVSGNITFSGSAARARYISTGASMTNIGGDFRAGGTLTTSGTGTFNFNGSVAQVMNAYATYNNVQINNTSGGVTFAGTTVIGGTLLVNTSTLDIDGVTATVTGATTVNGTLQISNTAGTKTFGDITVANGGLFNFTAAEDVTLNGNLTVNGTGAISGTTGIFTFQKIGGGTIGGTTTNVVTVAAATFSTNYANSIPFAVSGTTTVGGGIIVTNTGTFTAAGALSGATGTFTQGVNGVLNLGLTSAIGTLNAAAVPNAVHYTGTGAAQTVHAGTYYNLFIDKSGQTGTSGGAITVNNNLAVTAGNLSDGGFQITGNVIGALSVASGATLTLGSGATGTSFPTGFTSGNISLATSSTVNYNANQAQAISNVQNYGNLTLTATATTTKTAAGNLTVHSVLTVGANNILADGGFVITLQDGSVMNGAHTGTGKILFTGGSAVHSLSGTGSYANVELDDSNGAIQSGGSGTINGTLTLTTGTWDVNGKPFTVVGPTTVNSTLVLESSGGTKTFGDITVGTSGVINSTTASAVAVNGNLAVNGLGSITGTIGTWTFQKVGGGFIGGTAPSITILGGTTFATAYTLPPLFTVNTLTVNSTVTETNVGTTTVNTALAGAGAFTQGVGTVLRLGGSAGITTLNASANPNEVHLISTTGPQVIKPTTYYTLFIEKTGQTASVGGGTMNVLGALMDTAGTINFAGSSSTIGGAMDIYGALTDTSGGPAGGNNVFQGLVTVHPGASWNGIVGEVCDFHFGNGFVMNGASFTSATGNYIFETNNQGVTGSSTFTIDNVVVNGIQLTNGAALTVRTALTGTGAFVNASNTALVLSGTNTVASFDASSAGNMVTYNGSSVQAVNPAVYQALDVSANTAGNVNVSANTTADTALVLGATVFTTGSSTMIMGPGATVSRTTGFVNGNLQKNVSAGSPSPTFEIGSGTNYTPVTLNFHGVTASGNVLVNTTPGYEPNFATSNLLVSSSLERFYMVNNGGVGFGTYDAAFTFVPSDVDAGANTANFVVAEFSSSTWSQPTLGAVTSTSVVATGLTSFGDFQIGDLNNPVPIITTISPTSTTAGGAQFIITLTGSNFSASSTVEWNGSGVTTTFVSSSTITATITAADIAVAGTSTVTVVNPAPGGGTSGGVVFTVNPMPSGLGAVKFIFANVTSSAVVGNNVTFNIEAVTASDTIDTAFEQGVTLTVSGSGSGGGLVTIIDGVGTSTVSDHVAESVSLGLQDTQSTGLAVGLTANVTFVPGPVAQFTLDHPGNMNAGTRLGFTVSREDQFGNFASASDTAVYLYENSGSVNAAFLSAASGGVQVTSTLISDGSTSTVFWYYDDTSGSPTVTVSDNATAPDGAAGIADADDTFTVAPGAVKFIFANVSSGVTQGGHATVSVEAVDSSGNVITSFAGGVTVIASGAASGGGLVNVVNGVGTVTITDATAETVTLGLQDTQSTGLGVTATAQIVFTAAAPVAPPSISSPSGGGGGGGPAATQVFFGIKPGINITFSGMAYPGATVAVIRKDLGLQAAPVAQAIPVAADGSFVVQLNNVLRLSGQTYLLSFVDKNGLIAQTKAYNIPVQDKLVYGNILAAPTLGFENASVVSRSQPLVVTGYATPGATVALFIDGNPAGTVFVKDPSGKYTYPLTTDSLAFGRHSIWALQKYAMNAVHVSGYTAAFSQDEIFVDDAANATLFTKNSSGTYVSFVPVAPYVGQPGVSLVSIGSVYAKQAESDFSNQESFTISSLQDPMLDLNGDGVVSIGDLSMFLSYLKNLNADVTNFHISSPTLIKVLDFSGDGVVDVKDLDILGAAIGHP